MKGTAYAIKAGDLVSDDLILTGEFGRGINKVEWSEVLEVVFDDMYAEDGVWLAGQGHEVALREGTYAWPRPDIPCGRDALVVVLR